MLLCYYGVMMGCGICDRATLATLDTDLRHTIVKQLTSLPTTLREMGIYGFSIFFFIGFMGDLPSNRPAERLTVAKRGRQG